ncbi:hypothetical protein Tco_1516170 [Tanacetum coccineum]
MQTTCVVEEAATMPHDSPLPRVHLLRSDEGSMTLHELIVLCTILSNKVESLESDLKQTKLTYGAAYTKLIIKGRHEHDLEPNFDFTAPEEVYTAEPNISTTNVPVSIVGAKVSTIILEVKIDVESLVYIKRSAAKRKDKGKAIMKEVEPVQKKTKMQLEQERLGAEESSPEVTSRKKEENSSKVGKQYVVEMINERKELIIGSHTLQQLKKLSFDEIKELFETTIKRVKDFVPIESDRLVPKILTGSSKRTAETELEHEGSKRQKTNEEQSAEEEKELSEEELQKLMMIVPVEEVYVEALQVKYPIIDWEVYSEDTRKYWKIIRVGNHTEAYQTFDDMLKKFDRDDLDKLWSLVKERFSSTDPTDDKERTLWVELKRLFEPDIDDILWKLQRYMHDPLTWRLYDTCGVHHVSTDRGHDIFMLVEKDYPLTRGILTLMLCNKLQVDQYSEMANELLKKIFILANRPRQ